MSSHLLISNIGQLVTNTGPAGKADESLGLLPSHALLIEGDTIAWVGLHDDPAVHRARAAGVVEISAEGQVVMPGFVDSHTHLIHAGDRSDEFLRRMSGEAYAPGGIWDTVRATRSATDDELTEQLSHRLRQAELTGTTTIEIKTGYGLDIATEARLAAIASSVTDQVTFLGAHLVPPEFDGRGDDYVELVVGEMLDVIEPHVRFIDVFCERGAFSEEQSRRVLRAGVERGLIPTLHASQLDYGGGVAIAKDVGAVSLSHGTFLTDADVAELVGSNTVVTLLPGTEFATRQPYPDAKRLIDAGVTVAIASNCNPGSGYSSSMPLMVALAVREMGMTPADALYSATKGGADALALTDRGVIAPRMRADLVQLDAPDYSYLAYRPGVPMISRVIRAGSVIVDHTASRL
jgi:imidazolonepropionase